MSIHEENQVVQQIKKEMRDQKICVLSLSKMSMISQSTIHDILENKTSPRLVTLQAICDVLNLEIKASERDNYIENNELLTKIINLSSCRKKFVESIIDLLTEDDNLI